MNGSPLRDIRAVIDSVTTVIVVHPSDAVTIRAAAAQPGLLPIEVIENPQCPPGTAYAFKKDGGPLSDVPLPPPPGGMR